MEPSARGMKTCASCKVAYLATAEFFFRYRGRADGWHPYCKQCKNRGVRAWMERNKERLTSTQRAWRQRNPERMRAYRKNANARRNVRRQQMREVVLSKERDWRNRNPEKLREYRQREDPATKRRRTLRRLYGITPEDYERMLSVQGGVCAICGKPPNGQRLEVEHDHQSKKVRGLTHKLCNMIIGWADHNPQGLANLLMYLVQSKVR